MDKSPESERQGCPHIKEYRLMERERKPNPWMLGSTEEIVLSQRMLNNPMCLGAYLKDLSIYKSYSFNVIIYDEKQNVVLFRIQKPRIQ